MIHQKSATKLILTIPAKNESSYIMATLNSIKNQEFASHFNSYDYYQIIVLCNNCTDGTAIMCRSFARQNPHINIIVQEVDDSSIRNVGMARKLLMDLAALSLFDDDDIILMTDADTTFRSDAFACLSTYHDRQYDLICGKILVDMQDLESNVKYLLESKLRYEELKLQVENCWIPIPYDPFPKHTSHSGPCMAIKKKTYLNIGGIKPLDYFEDIELYENVISNGFKVRHDNNLVVKTSSRLNSRTDMGFGNELNYWTAHNIQVQDYEVEGVDRLNYKYKIYKELRKLFGANEIDSIHSNLHNLDIKSDRAEIQRFQNWQSLIFWVDTKLQVVLDHDKKYLKVPVTIAIAELETHFHKREQVNS